MARPIKPDSERREYRFQIRLSEEERKLIEQAAGDQASTWSRQLLVEAAKRRLKGK